MNTLSLTIIARTISWNASRISVPSSPLSARDAIMGPAAGQTDSIQPPCAKLLSPQKLLRGLIVKLGEARQRIPARPKPAGKPS